ncbi:MAG: Formate--phosphoribosylaminoimidazolecarboxamide ligase [Candidatus Fermentimicrarchaeum limneticum]|uniref:Formate--phosphoribosylaminoimidazolecarboxamide ligase n=1 Tax=Fermentimicrarchaeum limneticum TaxID=2795018 RepID=A0A7D5XKA6_FERL1|nr:MAG: Formate--phosphoribosylaminoimidazolecarboxamide ligase [Candidatus Fermentimicrarchaeum limneticum]
MIPRSKILDILKGYDKRRIKIASICSHSSLQIFHGAREEGMKTVGICLEQYKKTYDSFPYGKPHEYIIVDSYRDIPEKELVEDDAIIVPHGSFVEYTGKKLEEAAVPMFGNRMSLVWEGNRDKLFEWMRDSDLRVPKLFTPETIDRPCIVKLPGAKGGKGYTIVNSPEDFRKKVKEEKFVIQEYISGVRVYPHYFFSPIAKGGYEVRGGSLELMSIDKRLESNIDESYRATLAGVKVEPSFTVIGNEPITLRESLVRTIMEMGANVVESSYRLFGGLPGPFCVEMICTEDLKFYVFEISARIVAGTNLYPLGSPYTCYSYREPMSTGRRIAREIKRAAKLNKLDRVVY